MIRKSTSSVLAPAPASSHSQAGTVLADGFSAAGLTGGGAMRRSGSAVVKFLKTAVAAASLDRGKALSMSVPEP